MATPASSVSNTPIQLDDLIAAASKKEATATDYVNLSEAYVKSGKFHSAIGALNKALQIDKTSLPILRRQAEVYFQSGKYAEARNRWCQAVIHATEDSDLWRDAIHIARASHLLNDKANTSLWLKNAQNKAPDTEEAKQEIKKLTEFLNSKA